MMRINLDYASTTPLLPAVKQAMAAALEEAGNPSSIHAEGQRAKRALEQSRRQVAALINAKPEEVFFTSCGTEANNWALRGLLLANKRKGNRLVISAIEHPSVFLAARRLELDGFEVTTLRVDHEGVVSPAGLKEALKPQTALVSVMLANGEVGTIEPIKELAAIAHEQGALFHTDAVAAVGHVAVDVRALGVDALSLAANQFYGPQGAGALFVREGVRILPLLEGGGQERGGRSGTEAVPAIVGMGVAAEIAARELPDRLKRLAALRNRLHDGLEERIEGLRVNGPLDVRRVTRSRGPHAPGADDAGSVRRGEDAWGGACLRLPVAVRRRQTGRAGRGRQAVAGPVESHEDRRLPHNLHVRIEGVSSESLVLGLDHAGIAAGLGSACNAKAMRPSHVLKAMGLSDEDAAGALVLSVGVPTTEEEIDRALDAIPTVVQRLRRVTALTTRA